MVLNARHRLKPLHPTVAPNPTGPRPRSPRAPILAGLEVLASSCSARSAAFWAFKTLATAMFLDVRSSEMVGGASEIASKAGDSLCVRSQDRVCLVESGSGKLSFPKGGKSLVRRVSRCRRRLGSSKGLALGLPVAIIGHQRLRVRIFDVNSL